MRQALEITFVAIVLYLVLSRATAFSGAVRALASGYATAVRALQGR